MIAHVLFRQSPRAAALLLARLIDGEAFAMSLLAHGLFVARDHSASPWRVSPDSMAPPSGMGGMDHARTRQVDRR